MNTRAFLDALLARGAALFAGVPDSVLSGLSTLLAQEIRCRHVITANEGNAVGLAIGHYLATGVPGVVYMQNSGLGNAVNPLTSLADSDVYGVPMLLIIGWRGMPGVKDEPQHKKMGRITEEMLHTLGVPYLVGNAGSDPEVLTAELWNAMRAAQGPVALLLPKGALDAVPAAPVAAASSLRREEALARILTLARPEDCLIATTGKTGRELFELRVARGEPQQDFLTVGGMGHTASIALGVALARPERRVICLDGDGSLIMHMGAMGVIGQQRPHNLIHVLLNNGCHESVGGQPTVAPLLDFKAIARACGYAAYRKITAGEEIEIVWAAPEMSRGPVLLEIVLAPGSRADLGRPTTSPAENRRNFMKHAGNVDPL